jgi:hypothetical protein
MLIQQTVNAARFQPLIIMLGDYKRMRIYKYMSEKYLYRFINNGEVLFHSLSYFRNYEDAQIRGDLYEGTRKFHPNEGLTITKTKTGETFKIQYSFESTAKEDDIFVFCTSTLLSSELAKLFDADVCVEICDLTKFISMLHAAIIRRSRVKNETLLHQEVFYYPEDHPPLVDWALPEKITMSKLDINSNQQEYRFAFCINNAFKIENTNLRLVKNGNRKASKEFSHPKELLLKLGSLSNFCKVHKFRQIIA